MTKIIDNTDNNDKTNNDAPVNIDFKSKKEDYIFVLWVTLSKKSIKDHKGKIMVKWFLNTLFILSRSARGLLL